MNNRQGLVFSGMRPTGRLHIGNYWGALRNWVDLQAKYPCIYSVADWHMLTTGYDDTAKLQENIREITLDWLAAGVDPDKSIIFKQSDVSEHAELALMLSMVTPLSWLENNPTWKEQLQELSRTKETLAREELDQRRVYRAVFQAIVRDLFAQQQNDPNAPLVRNFIQHLANVKSPKSVFPVGEIAAWLGPHAAKHLIAESINMNAVIDREGLDDITAEESARRFIQVVKRLKDERVTTRNLAADFLAYFEKNGGSQQIGFADFVSWFARISSELQKLRNSEIRSRDAVIDVLISICKQLPHGVIPLNHFRGMVNEVFEDDSKERLRTAGFLGYPVLQTADILLYKGTKVPVGQDQLPHLELSRKIARKFNHFFGDVFAEPQPLLTPTPRITGLDGRKMSKSYGNALDIFETEESLRKKVMSSYTDPNRKRATDPGNPEPCPLNPPGCPVYGLHKLYANEDFIQKRKAECVEGRIGCVACKKDLLSEMDPPFADFRARREKYASDPKLVDEVLKNGAEKARVIAQKTMGEVRRAMRLS